MLRIANLLDQKNHYLEKFYSLNETEIKKFLSGNFDGLERFYDNRERVLEIIKYIDSQIDSIHNQIMGTPDADHPQAKTHIASALRIKDQYVTRIMEQDLEILSCIEATKNSIIRELNDLKKGKKAVAGYRAPDFQKNLNEEA